MSNSSVLVRGVTYLLIYSLKEKKKKLLWCSWWTKATFEMPLSTFLFGTSVSNFLPSPVKTKAPRVMQKKEGVLVIWTQQKKTQRYLSLVRKANYTKLQDFLPSKAIQKTSSRHILPEDHLQETSKFVAVCPSHWLLPRRREGVWDGW